MRKEIYSRLTTALRLRRRSNQSISPRLLDAGRDASIGAVAPLDWRKRRGLLTTSNARGVPDVTESLSLENPASKLRLHRLEGPHDCVRGRGDDGGETLCTL